MAHTFYRHYYHIVFGCEGRRCSLARDLREDLWPYLQGAAKKCDAKILEAGGMPDHVHLLLEIPPSCAVSQVVGKLKANSSRWISDRAGRFGWQRGFSSFTVSHSLRSDVVNYIRRQVQHHCEWTLDEELRRLLEKHEVVVRSEP